MSMSTYRAVWMLVMVFIVAPAFIVASGMEGLDFEHSVTFTLITLQNYGAPYFLVSLIAYPVTVVATLIPGTSSLAVLFGDFFLWKGLGVVLLLAFFINFEPPFYREVKESE